MGLRSANIIGSGPNGLAAAITLARAGVQVTVYERGSVPGGGCATAELTLPGFRHDIASSVYPLGAASPFFRTLPLARFGLRWVYSPAALAHPLPDGTSVTLEPRLEDTAAQLGRHDGQAWTRLMQPLVDNWESLVNMLLRPLWSVPRKPLQLAAFGLYAGMPATLLARQLFRHEAARTLFAGNAAHSVMPLTSLTSAASGLVLAAAGHATGWPVAEGGAAALARALSNYFVALGGRILLDAEIRDFGQLEPADVTLFDTSTLAVDRIAGEWLTPSFRMRMAHFRYGPGAFKLDWALREPIPWRSPGARRAATVHLGGSLDEIVTSEERAYRGESNGKPFVLLAQPSLFDGTRAPFLAGGEPGHTAWAYCHVPNGSHEDMTEAIEAQIERFAPGFRECILARSTWSPAHLETWNPNLVGGNVSGGSMTLPHLLARPTAHLWRTSHPRIYMCSASTPPGGGVHGMCGHLAAQAVLRDHGRA